MKHVVPCFCTLRICDISREPPFGVVLFYTKSTALQTMKCGEITIERCVKETINLYTTFGELFIGWFQFRGNRKRKENSLEGGY